MLPKTRVPCTHSSVPPPLMRAALITRSWMPAFVSMIMCRTWLQVIVALPNDPRGSGTLSCSSMDEASAADDGSIKHLGEHSAPTDEKNTMNCFDDNHAKTSCE